jgi:uncharacterized Rmd1/YagE family protein
MEITIYTFTGNKTSTAKRLNQSKDHDMLVEDSVYITATAYSLSSILIHKQRLSDRHFLPMNLPDQE